jgi:hypothetical protein
VLDSTVIRTLERLSQVDPPACLNKIRSAIEIFCRKVTGKARLIIYEQTSEIMGRDDACAFVTGKHEESDLVACIQVFSFAYSDNARGKSSIGSDECVTRGSQPPLCVCSFI